MIKKVTYKIPPPKEVRIPVGFDAKKREDELRLASGSYYEYFPLSRDFASKCRNEQNQPRNTPRFHLNKLLPPDPRRKKHLL